MSDKIEQFVPRSADSTLTKDQAAELIRLDTFRVSDDLDKFERDWAAFAGMKDRVNYPMRRNHSAFGRCGPAQIYLGKPDDA